MHPVPTPPDRLAGLAPELLELVLSFLAPRDITSFGRTCQRARTFIRPSNKILWRSAFLQIFDDPKHAWALLLPTARAEDRQRESSWDWFQELHRRCTAFNAVCETGNGALLANPEHVVTALLDVLDTASYTKMAGVGNRVSLNVEFLERLFRIAPKAERIVHDYHRDVESMSLPLELMREEDHRFTRSMLAQQQRTIAIPEWASRFHVSYGKTKREDLSLQAKSTARRLVYDWSVTGPNSDYGPFASDGSGTVNWQTLEAITSLMHRIFDSTRGLKLLTPSGFRNNIPHTLSQDPLHPEDWAGINRIWVGTYAFLDYRALVHYNFANTIEQAIDLSAYEESSGDLMHLRLQISDDEELRGDHRLKSDLPYCKDLPKLYFEGHSGGRPGGRLPIIVRGSACLVPGARQVRWRFIISYSGVDQWQLEGVQPGGIRSGGIYGLWSHVDHEEHGPMGPFFYAPYNVCHTSGS
ncbi:hypothetical protein K505DRAFT_374020 [Melanomma pulvis-pyrius CBS 109.77]|uniref:F-box domain-containing protein n=1 Tax=Melanomma pulvis-pyrius CBS 109.77 TaxID=1314802 RepID=A0A6A6XGY2_9PLEO|nr:hypothetical protein K505DRAFT_374020 [Melanomma pulvis-pyrius CBS 109.77]